MAVGTGGRRSGSGTCEGGGGQKVEAWGSRFVDGNRKKKLSITVLGWIRLGLDFNGLEHISYWIGINTT